MNFFIIVITAMELYRAFVEDFLRSHLHKVTINWDDNTITYKNIIVDLNDYRYWITLIKIHSLFSFLGITNNSNKKIHVYPHETSHMKFGTLRLELNALWYIGIENKEDFNSEDLYKWESYRHEYNEERIFADFFAKYNIKLLRPRSQISYVDDENTFNYTYDHFAQGIRVILVIREIIIHYNCIANYNAILFGRPGNIDALIAANLWKVGGLIFTTPTNRVCFESFETLKANAPELNAYLRMPAKIAIPFPEQEYTNDDSFDPLS